MFAEGSFRVIEGKMQTLVKFLTFLHVIEEHSKC